MKTRTKKWQWLRDSLKEESESIAKIVYYEEREHTLDDLFGNPMEQLEEIFKLGGKDESTNNT